MAKNQETLSEEMGGLWFGVLVGWIAPLFCFCVFTVCFFFFAVAHRSLKGTAEILSLVMM